MKRTLYAAAAAILAASLVVANAQTGSTPSTSHSGSAAKKHAPAKKPSAPPAPSVQDQIQALRTEMQTQIDSLRNDLSAKDAQLRQAQQDAADARAAANKAEADTQAQQQAFTQNTDAVTTLQTTVSDLKTNQLSLATTVSDETTSLKKSIANPDAIMFKGITLSPTGSFIEAATVWRQGATGDDINTGATSVPLQNADGAGMSEFFGSARQSRIALKATGKIASMTMTGYYEADWLSSGTTSNNNQSNSYTMRQRELWADAKTTSGWDFSGGTGWSLVTETASGLTRGTQTLPSTIDAQYDAGFVWSRQESFRVVKNIGTKAWFGMSAENAETLNAAGSGLPSNYLFGSTGTGGGLYDNQANYSFNLAPDLVAKVAVEPGWGHWEAFGVGRFFRDRIYPTTGSPYNDMEPGGGIGGGFRGPLANKKVTIGLKGLYGIGVGRYGNSTIADVTVRPTGILDPLKGFSALSTVEMNPTPRLNVYLNYGGDYIYRDFVVSGTNSGGNTYAGYGVGGPSLGTSIVNAPAMTGCLVETAPASTSVGAAGSNQTAPANCAGNNKDVQEFVAGYWYNIYSGPKGRLRQGITYQNIRRDIWSGNGGTANPGGGAHGDDNMFFTSFRYYLP
jgi:Skp family chaperone for outer membrane proteins